MTTKEQDAGVLLNKSTRGSPSENFIILLKLLSEDETV